MWHYVFSANLQWIKCPFFLTMIVRILIPLILLSVASGCSTYDVLALSADAALSLFDDDAGKNSYNDDRNRIWDPEVSDCIQVQKSRNWISSQLDAIEQDKDFVVLPTGEKYPVVRKQRLDEPMPGPTKKCLTEHAD